MNTNLVSAVVSAIVEAGDFAHRSQTSGAKLAQSITALYADVSGSDADFAAAFGNGRPAKAKDFIAGAVAEGVKAGTAKMKDKARVESIARVLKQRLYEARKLRALGGMPAKDENLQAALKRYATAKDAKGAKPEGNEASAAVIIPDSASMDDIADALSVWIAKHGNAAAGLASKLKDFLPVSVRRRAAS